MNTSTSPSKSGKTEIQLSGPSQLDSNLCDELEKLVEKMTHSGRPSLEEQPLKQLKKICRTSDAYVEHAFNLLSSQLTEEHAEIRLSTFQIMREIFTRSHHFRELLVADMQEFLELVMGTNSDLPLPPPRAAANLLKEQTLDAIQEWNAKYGKAYKKLALGYGFLKYNKMVDFANLEARSAAEQRAQEARQAKLQLALAQKISRTLNDMEETIPEMNECLTQIENCFELLLPHPTRYHETTFPSDAVESTSRTAMSNDVADQTIPVRGVSEDTAKSATSERTTCTDEKITVTPSNRTSEQSNNSDSAKTDVKSHEEENEGRSSEDPGRLNASPVHAGKEDGLLQQHGLPSWNYSIEINVNTDGVTLEEDEDNQAILATLEDMDRLIKTAYLPHLANWMEVLSKSGKHEDKLKRCMDIKQALQNAAAKYAELSVHPKDSNRGHRRSSLTTAEEGRDSEGEDEFEEVPEKEGYEPFIPDHLREEYGLSPSSSTSQDTKQLSATEESTKNTTTLKTLRSSSNSTTTTSASSTISSKPLESWHPLREAQHVLADPASQAGTIQAMKERLRAIRDRQSTQDLFGRKRKSSDNSTEDLSSVKRHRQQLLAKAPVVPFGVDLEHWSNPEKIEAPTVVLADTAQCVWSSSAPDEVKVLEAAKESLTTRVFNYTGKFEPVKWTCRAPLPSGKLCQRMDRYKCPFHGRIVPRDEQGNPEKAEDKAEFQLSKEQQIKAKSLLVAADLQQDIEDGLGLDLGGSPSISGKGKDGNKGKGKAKKHPNLTDLKKTSNTAMTRLEKRVLNKTALQRVANAMNKLEQRRYHDKFSNNFNYR